MHISCIVPLYDQLLSELARVTASRVKSRCGRLLADQSLGGLEAHAAHFAFEDFFGVGRAALQASDFDFAQFFVAAGNAGQGRSRQFAFGDFAAADNFGLGGLEDAFDD